MQRIVVCHSLSGCDYTSSFYHFGKVEFWDAWLKNSVLSEKFLLYSNRPTLPLAEENLKVIESFVVSLYVTELNILTSVDIARSQSFKYRGNSEIRSLPPARDTLIQHIHKCIIQHIYLVISGEHRIYRQEPQSPTNWTWSFTDNRIKCQWVSDDHFLITQNLNKTVFKKCGC